MKKSKTFKPFLQKQPPKPGKYIVVITDMFGTEAKTLNWHFKGDRLNYYLESGNESEHLKNASCDGFYEEIIHCSGDIFEVPVVTKETVLYCKENVLWTDFN